MRNWRIITAAAAVVLAMLAAVLAYQYLNQADERASDKIEQVEAYVVVREIPKGTSGSTAIADGLIERREVTKKDLPPTAITSDDQIAEKVAASLLVEGEVVVDSNFLASAQVSGFSGNIEEGKQAVTMQVDPQHGVANFISPGDSINIMVTLELGDVTKPSRTPITTSAYLIPGVKVLAVGTTTVTSTPTDGEQAVTQDLGLLTLEVTPRQALQITHAQNGAGIAYLSLNPQSFDVEDFEIPTEIVEAVNWFDQELTFAAQVAASIPDANQ